MSGGYFDYKQYQLGYISDSIETIVRKYDEDGEDSYGDKIRTRYSSHEIDVFRQAIFFIRKAQVYAHRIDWLLSGDDSAESFFARLGEDLKDLDEEMKKIDRRNEKRRVPIKKSPTDEEPPHQH